MHSDLTLTLSSLSNISELTMISFSPRTFCRLLLLRMRPLGTVTPLGGWGLPLTGPDDDVAAAEESPFTTGAESELEDTVPFSKSGSFLCDKIVFILVK